MELIPYLYTRQSGVSRCKGLYNSHYRPNLDSILKRLVCREEDVYLSSADGTFVPPLCCKFRKDKHQDLLAVANEDGVIMLIDTNSDRGVVKNFFAHQNVVFDISWLPDKNHLVTGSGDHTASFFDMNTCQKISTFRKHKSSIKSVDVCHRDSALFATASRDGNICIWDTRDKCMGCDNAQDKPSICIQLAHCRMSARLLKDRKNFSHDPFMSSVSAVAFQDEHNIASAGAADGVVKIWDLRKSYISKPTYVPSPRYQMKYRNGDGFGHGCTCLVFDSVYKKLYACGTDSKIYLFDCHTYSDAKIAYEGLRCDTYFVKVALSADDQYLLSGSSDCNAYVWKTANPGLPILQFPGHKSEVTSVTWGSHDVSKFVTCGDDNNVLVWKTTHQESNEPPLDVYAASSVYQKADQSKNNHETPLPSTPTFVQMSSTKKPVMKSITNFFPPALKPLSERHPDQNLTSVAASNSVEEVVDKNNEPSSSKPLSPKSILSQGSTPLHSTIHSKENHFGHFSSDSSNSASTPNVQAKRKADFQDSTPKLKKHQTGRKKKLNSQSARKQNVDAKGTITNYFSVSLSPEE